MTRRRTPFVDAMANGDTVAVSDAAAVGDMAPFDVMYEIHAFHPRQYICMLHMPRQTRRGEARLYCYSPRQTSASLVHECGQRWLASPRARRVSLSSGLAHHEVSGE